MDATQSDARSPRGSTVPGSTVPGRRVTAAAVALLMIAVLGSCRLDPVAATPGPSDEILVVFDRDPSDFPGDDWHLLDGEIDGDSLSLRVQYSGGCRDHEFWLLAVDGWLPLPDQGVTATVGVPLHLSHDDHGDGCEALISRTLRFGLAPLADAYRDRFGAGPARLLLQLTDGRDGFAIHVFEWRLE